MAVGLTLTALLAGGGWLVYLGRDSQVAIDVATLCPTDRPPTLVQVLLLDASDALSEAQRLQVANELERARASLPALARVEVYAIDRAGQNLIEPLATLCNPGDGSHMNMLYQNPALARQRWQQLFDAPLERLTNTQLAARDADASPIYEALQAVAVRTFDRPQFDGVPKQLVIVSDLLQHPRGGGGHSHYRGVPRLETLTGSRYFARVRADLTAVQVKVIYLDRADVDVQGAEHLRFWERLLAVEGAQLVEVRRVFGDA